jgi:hypothetical protein
MMTTWNVLLLEAEEKKRKEDAVLAANNWRSRVHSLKATPP